MHNLAIVARDIITVATNTHAIFVLKATLLDFLIYLTLPITKYQLKKL